MDIYTISELSEAYLVAQFTVGETVTIKVTNLSTGLDIALDDDVCIPHGTNGKFRWATDNITTKPSSFTEYTWEMKDSKGNIQSNKLRVGGWPDDISGSVLPANMCKVTTNLFEGECPTETGVKATATLTEAYFADNRYFEVTPKDISYTSDNGAGFWVLPQGATVEFNIPDFGITNKTGTIPNTTTATLNNIINP